jgi:hypothetical protein
VLCHDVVPIVSLKSKNEQQKSKWRLI